VVGPDELGQPALELGGRLGLGPDPSTTLLEEPPGLLPECVAAPSGPVDAMLPPLFGPADRRLVAGLELRDAARAGLGRRVPRVVDQAAGAGQLQAHPAVDRRDLPGPGPLAAPEPEPPAAGEAGFQVGQVALGALQPELDFAGLRRPIRHAGAKVR